MAMEETLLNLFENPILLNWEEEPKDEDPWSLKELR